MKQIAISLVLLLLLNLCGCSILPVGTNISNIETLKRWSFQYNEGAVNKNRMLKAASADEFFNKWNQYKTVLEGLQNIPKIKQCIEKLKSFFLQGLTRRENDLSICRDIKLAYARDQLSPKQLEELDLRKLEDSLNRLPKEIKQIKDCLGRLKSLFKFILIKLSL